MLIQSAGIVNGYIEQRFGKYAATIDQLQNTPIRSLPLSWSELPPNTKTLALVMQDYDAAPVCGFSWLHWLVANIDPVPTELKENASRENHNLLQGKNSLAAKQLNGNVPANLINFYAGPRPPDKDHEYELTLYALDVALDLQPGFAVNELRKAMRGHILDSATIQGIYRY